MISRRKVTQLSATFFSLILITTSCKKEGDNIGDSLQDESLNVSTVDTFTIVTYSEEVDSMESDETAISLLGSYIDPEFGGVDCGMVFQVVPSSFGPDLGSAATTTVDSVILSLRYSDLLRYGTETEMTFEVYEITDDLEREDQDYYTFETPNHTGTNLVDPAGATQTPDLYNFQVVGDDTLDAHIRIPLLTTVGDEIVADNDAGLLANDDAWLGAFKGLYVKADNSTLSSGEGSVFYIALEDILSELTIYFTEDGSQGEYSFHINSSTARYNEMQFDRSGTDVDAALADITQGMNSFYTQAGAIRGVVEFPYIENFNYDSEGNYDPKIINRAELFLPVESYTPDAFNPSRTLFVARVVDDKVSTFTVDYNFGGSLSDANTVSYDEENKRFRFIMTREIQSVLTGETENVGYRIYPPNFFASSVERVIFNGPNSDLKEKPRLEITYTDY